MPATLVSRAPKLIADEAGSYVLLCQTLPPPLQFPHTRGLLELVAIAQANHWTAISVRCQFPAASLKQLLVKRALMNHLPADFSTSSWLWPDGFHWSLLIIIYARSGPERVAFPIQEKGHSMHQQDE